MTRGKMGEAFLRDPDFPCDHFMPGKPGEGVFPDCGSDGHYLCGECCNRAVCPGGCGQAPGHFCCCEEIAREAGQALEGWLAVAAPYIPIYDSQDFPLSVMKAAERLDEVGFRGHLVVHPEDFRTVTNRMLEFAPTRGDYGKWMIDPSRVGIYVSVPSGQIEIRSDPRVERGSLTAMPKQRLP